MGQKGFQLEGEYSLTITIDAARSMLPVASLCLTPALNLPLEPTEPLHELPIRLILPYDQLNLVVPPPIAQLCPAAARSLGVLMLVVGTVSVS